MNIRLQVLLNKPYRLSYASFKCFFTLFTCRKKFLPHADPCTWCGSTRSSPCSSFCEIFWEKELPMVFHHDYWWSLRFFCEERKEKNKNSVMYNWGNCLQELREGVTGKEKQQQKNLQPVLLGKIKKNFRCIFTQLLIIFFYQHTPKGFIPYTKLLIGHLL